MNDVGDFVTTKQLTTAADAGSIPSRTTHYIRKFAPGETIIAETIQAS